MFFRFNPNNFNQGKKMVLAELLLYFVYKKKNSDYNKSKK